MLAEEQRQRLGKELPKVIGRRVLALGFVSTGGRRLTRGKEDVVTEAYGSGPESSVGIVGVWDWLGSGEARTKWETQ